MVRPSTFKLDNLEPNRKTQFHQHALDYVLNGNRGIPTQLVYPDRSLAVGLPPSQIWNHCTETANRAAQRPETREEREARLRRVTVLIHASEATDDDVRPKVRRLFLCFVLCLSVQLGLLGWMIAGGAKDGSGFTAARRTIYSAMTVAHCLFFLGVLSRVPNMLSLHGVLCAILWFFGFFWCISSFLDVIVVMALPLLRYCSLKIRFYLIPHAFSVPPGS